MTAAVISLLFNLFAVFLFQQVKCDVVYVSLIAGTRSTASPFANGFRTSATFNNPHELAEDSSGNLFVADYTNHQIRRIDASTGQVSTFAGSTSGYRDAVGTTAQFQGPNGLVIDVSGGQVYVSEGTGNRIRKIDITTRSVSTFATSGPWGSFNVPSGLAIDSQKNIFVADCYAMRVRKITPASVVTTMAGTYNYPTDVVVDSADNVLVADKDNGAIKKIVNGVVSTIATGLSQPWGFTIDSLDNLFVSEITGTRLRKIYASDNSIVTIPISGTLSEGYGTMAVFDSVRHLFANSKNEVMISNLALHMIRKVTFCEGAAATFVAGSCSCLAGYELTGNYICQQCLAGSYRTLAMAACATCPLGYGLAADQTSCTPCGYGQVRTAATTTCVDCPVGFEAAANKTVCVPCSSGYYRPSTYYARCVQCPQYSVCNSTSAISCINGYKLHVDGVTCESCPIGFISNDGVNCVSCNSGTTYRSDLAQSSCLACPLNSNCLPTGFTCNAGYELTGNGLGCSQCQEGYSKSGSGNTPCSQCLIGTESAADRQSCTPCASGKYRPNTVVNMCIPCPSGGTCTASVSTCNAGYKLNAAGDGCEQCPIGQESNAGRTACVSCTAGTNYRATLSQTSCIACPSNSGCTATGFTCNAGYEPALDGLGCSQCLDGFSKPASGNAACTQCSIGTESLVDRQSCSNCASGFYRSTTSYNKCIPCPTGASCSTTAITRCPNGFKVNSNGNGCEQCPTGQDSGDGLNCQGCIAGYFKPDQSYQVCVKCPDGSPSCGGSLVSCQSGYYFDSNVQCKRNDTYFAQIQTGTNTASTMTAYVTVTQTTTSTTTSTSISVFTVPQYFTQTTASIVTVTQTSVNSVSHYLTVNYVSNQVSTVTVGGNANVETVTVTDGVSLSQEQQSANSVTLDFIGTTLPISPLIFGVIAFGMGLFLMLIVSLICCRGKTSMKQGDLAEFDGMTTLSSAGGMNTQSQRTFTNTMTR